MMPNLEFQIGSMGIFHFFAARSQFPTLGRGGSNTLIVIKGVKIYGEWLFGKMVNTQFRLGKRDTDKQENN